MFFQHTRKVYSDSVSLLWKSTFAINCTIIFSFSFFVVTYLLTTAKELSSLNWFFPSFQFKMWCKRWICSGTCTFQPHLQTLNCHRSRIALFKEKDWVWMKVTELKWPHSTTDWSLRFQATSCLNLFPYLLLLPADKQGVTQHNGTH